MAEEARVRASPELRADRFVEQWQELERTRTRLERAGDDAGADKLGKRMEDLAGALHRDPQLESVLRRRAPELGVEIGRNRDMGQELARSIGIGRGRDHGLSL